VCCSVLQCVAVCCSVLQCVAVCLYREWVLIWLSRHTNQSSTNASCHICDSSVTYGHSFICDSFTCDCCSVLQCVAVCCSVYMLIHMWLTCVTHELQHTHEWVMSHTWVTTHTHKVCIKLRVSFRKRATNYRALLRQMTYQDVTYRYFTNLSRRHTYALCHTYAYMGWLWLVGSIKL